MIQSETNNHKFSKRCLQVVTYCGAAATVSLVFAATLVLTITLSDPSCNVECRGSSMAVGIVLLGFSVLSLLSVVFCAVELCRRKVDLLKRVVVVDGVDRLGVPVRDQALERLVQTSEDSRHVTRAGRSRIVQAAREQQEKLDRVGEALVPVGVTSTVNKYVVLDSSTSDQETLERFREALSKDDLARFRAAMLSSHSTSNIDVTKHFFKPTPGSAVAQMLAEYHSGHPGQMPPQQHDAVICTLDEEDPVF